MNKYQKLQYKYKKDLKSCIDNITFEQKLYINAAAKKLAANRIEFIDFKKELTR